MKDKLKLGFEAASVRIPISQILPLRAVPEKVKKSVKYAQIAASIKEVGIIEPPVVIRDADPNMYQLLDGHLRIEVLKDEGISAVVCLISTDDEAYTYNKRINRLAIIQEHRMIITALDKGVSEERLARALNVNIKAIRSRAPTARGHLSGGGRLAAGQACGAEHVSGAATPTAGAADRGGAADGRDEPVYNRVCALACRGHARDPGQQAQKAPKC